MGRIKTSRAARREACWPQILITQSTKRILDCISAIREKASFSSQQKLQPSKMRENVFSVRLFFCNWIETVAEGVLSGDKIENRSALQLRIWILRRIRARRSGNRKKNCKKQKIFPNNLSEWFSSIIFASIYIRVLGSLTLALHVFFCSYISSRARKYFFVSETSWYAVYRVFRFRATARNFKLRWCIAVCRILPDQAPVRGHWLFVNFLKGRSWKSFSRLEDQVGIIR